MSRFLEALRSGKVLLMEGAMGTELIRRGASIRDGTHYCTIEAPHVVEAIHREYVQAGATCLLTNTFQAHLPADGSRETLEQLEVVNRKAARTAHSAGYGHAFVLGSIGPMPECWNPETQKPAWSTVNRWGTQIEWLAGTNLIDGFLLETQPSPDLSLALAEEVRVYGSNLPVLASFVFENFNGNPQCDELVASDVATILDKEKGRFAAIGVNCGLGMDVDAVLKVVRDYRQATTLPILVRPNAGSGRVGDRWHYPLTPARFAERIPELVEAGATLIGGCCGTTPDHIAAAREVLEGMGVLWKPT